MARPEARLECFKGIGFIQKRLQLISHQSTAKLGFFLMGLMSVSLKARGTLPSWRDPLIIAIAHPDVIGLAALISQAGQGSREEVVARQQSSTLSTISDVTG